MKRTKPEKTATIKQPGGLTMNNCVINNSHMPITDKQVDAVVAIARACEENARTLARACETLKGATNNSIGLYLDQTPGTDGSRA